MLFGIIASANAYVERDLLQKAADIPELKSVLLMDRQWVPYPDYTDRTAWEQFLGDYRNDYIKQGEKRLGYEWKVVKATDYIEYERSGNRRIMEDPFGSNNGAIADLVMAELAEGKGRFIDQLINGVFQSCEMTSWVLSAHLSAQHSKRSLPDYKEDVIDLTAGDLGSLLSWTYYFFHTEFDKVNPVISERLRHELQKRILDTYMKEDRFWWMAFDVDGDKGFVNNWNTWCNSNILQCFLLLENDREKLAKAVYRSMVSVDKYINYTKSDGACEEGPSYWGHSAGKLFDYLHLIYNATNGKISLFSNPIIKNMGEYISRSYVGNGWVVNFADASAREQLDYHLIARYGDKVDSKELKEFSAYLKKQHYRPVTIERDMLRTLESFRYDREIDSYPPAHPHIPYTYYPETQFCYLANKTLFLAAKAGYNDESHNHNDVGTFNLYVNNQPVIVDIGVETYTGKTFSKDRYTIWTMQSDYHNLPQINGQQQEYGRAYKAGQVEANPDKKTFLMDIAGAYPQKAGIEKWQRTYRLAANTLHIEDNFQLDNPSVPNRQHFIVWGDAKIIQPGTIRINSNNEFVELTYNPLQLNATIETLEVKDPRLTRVWGNELTRIILEASDTQAQGIYKTTIKSIRIK